MIPRLHSFWRASAPYRVRIGLNLKGLVYDYVAIDLESGEQGLPAFRALNPQQLVPLYDDGGGAITQSLAILEYLDERHPDPPFLPGDARERARIRAAAQVVACDIHPINNKRVLLHLAGPLGQGEAAVEAWIRHWIALGFASLEAETAGSRHRYLLGDAPTLADILLVPQMYKARRFGVDLAPFPRLVAVDAALQEIEAFARARPELQPDAA